MPIKINGELYDFIGSPGHPPEVTLEIDNSGAEDSDVEIRLTDVNETDPSGRFRLRVSGDSITVERKLSADWATSKTLLTIGKGGSSIQYTETGLVELIAQLQMELEAGGLVAIRLKQLIETALL